jgi:hypothetical protein
MKQPSELDIAEMKARGYDPSTILEAVADTEAQGKAAAAASAQNKQELVRSAIIAQAILDGRVSLIAGARQLSDLALAHAPKPLDEDFSAFVTFDDRTCEFPIGDFRQFWASDALVIKDSQAAQIEEQFREILLEACRHLVLRFGSS